MLVVAVVVVKVKPSLDHLYQTIRNLQNLGRRTNRPIRPYLIRSHRCQHPHQQVKQQQQRQTIPSGRRKTHGPRVQQHARVMGMATGTTARVQALWVEGS